MPAKLKRKLTDVYKIDNVKDRRRERPKKQTRCIEGKDGVRTNSLKQTNDTTEQRVDVRPDSGKQTINDTDSLTNIKPPMKHSNVFAMKIKETGDSYDAPWNTAATNRGVPTAEKDTGDIITSLSRIEVYKQAPICVKSLWDELDCYVTGIDVLDDGRLIIADRSNRNIKLFDQNRHHMSSYVWPRSIVEERGPDGIASTSNNDIFVIFFKSVKRLQLKNSQLCDRGTFFSNGDWIRCITAQNENVFILTQIQGGKKYVHRLNSEGHSLWVVSVESFANFNVSGHGYHLTSFNYGDKVNILLSGSAKGKLDGKSGTKLEIEQVDFAGPVSYANSLVYFCYYDSNEIFALVPNSNKIKLIIKLPNALYHFPHIGTRSRPQPPIYSINCLVYNPTNEQILVSYGPNNPTTNYLDCIQLKEAI